MSTTKQERVAHRRRWRSRMLAPVNDDICFGTGKIRYRSAAAAAAAAETIPHPELFVYWCQMCHGPHLTKQRPRKAVSS